MWLLDDIVGADPAVVFCGMAGATTTRTRDHYYETPGNSFWESLHLSGFTPDLWRPEDDVRLPSVGVGVTDLVRHRDLEGDGRDVFEVDELAAKLTSWRPQWLAFTSKTVAAAAARTLGTRPPGLGPSDVYVGGVQAFVLPGTSGANRRRDYDGRPTRVAWWRDLAALTDRGSTDRG